MKKEAGHDEVPPGHAMPGRLRGKRLFRLVAHDARILMVMLRDPDFRFQAKTKFMVIGSLIYLCIPFDLIPIFIPILGITDDLAFLLAAATLLHKEIAEYEETRLGTRRGTAAADDHEPKY